jgi:hypothetical protein
VASVNGFDDTAVVTVFIPATKRFQTTPDSPKAILHHVDFKYTCLKCIIMLLIVGKVTSLKTTIIEILVIVTDLSANFRLAKLELIPYATIF